MESRTTETARTSADPADGIAATATLASKAWIKPQFEREPLKNALSGVSTHYDNTTSS